MINVRLQTSPLSYQALMQSGRDVSGGSSGLTRITKAPQSELMSQSRALQEVFHVPAELDTWLEVQFIRVTALTAISRF